ncbi:9060_t:CDS:10 [Entrophospora sp. SA101]|nr:9060_t:CDS:10 [Entrophospora sp. SA101]
MVLKVKALYDCSADDDSELSFKKGDIIVDVTKTNEEGWLEGRKEDSNIKGLFPSNYVQLIEEKKIPPKIPPRKIGTNSNNNIQEIDKLPLFETGSSGSIKDPAESDIGISIGKPRKISKNTLAVFESNETLPIKPSINPRSKLSPSLVDNSSSTPQTPPRPFSSTNSSTTSFTKSVAENHTDNSEKAKITTQDQSVKVVQQGISNNFSQLKGEFEKSPYGNKKISAIKSSQSPPPLPSRKNLGLSTDSEIKIPHRPLQYSGIPSDAKKRYELVFDSNKEEDLIDAAVVREIYIRSRLNNKTLYKIWDLLDTDKDGYLNRNEFCIGMFLIDKRLEGDPVPDKLPKELLV